MISVPIVHLVQTVHLSCTDTNTISKKRSKIPHDPCHLGVPSGASKMISEPMVRLTQTMHLSCVKISTISKRREISLEPCHLGYDRVCPKRFLSLWYVRRKPCTYLASRLALCPKGQNEIPLEPRHLVVPSCASKMISKPMVRLAQTMHLSCTDTNTVSKWKEVRFHMTHVT